MKSTLTTPKRQRLISLVSLALFVASTAISILPMPTAFAARETTTPENCLDFSKYGAPPYSQQTKDTFAKCRTNGNTPFGYMSVREQVLSYTYMSAMAACAGMNGASNGSNPGRKINFTGVKTGKFFSRTPASGSIGADGHIALGIISVGTAANQGLQYCDDGWPQAGLTLWDAKMKQASADDLTFSDNFQFVCLVLGMQRTTSDQKTVITGNACYDQTAGNESDVWGYPFGMTAAQIRERVLNNIRDKIYNGRVDTGNPNQPGAAVRNEWDIQHDVYSANSYTGAQMYYLYYDSLVEGCGGHPVATGVPVAADENWAQITSLVVPDDAHTDGLDYMVQKQGRVAWSMAQDTNGQIALAIDEPYDKSGFGWEPRGALAESILSHPSNGGCTSIVQTMNDHPQWSQAYLRYLQMDAAEANAPGSSTDPGQKGTGVATTEDCGAGSLNIWACAIIHWGLDQVAKLDSWIMSILDVDVGPIFDHVDDHSSASYGYYMAWNSFRVIAIALLVIVGLIMVISQAMGFELLDAYTVRKTLPRLLVAIIGISLSWPLMRLVVDFFDSAGFGVRSLMYAPFANFNGGMDWSTSIVVIIFGAGGATLLALGGVAFTFIITALLGVAVGFFTLVVRQIGIILLIIVAPIAIACYVLPNTQKVWKLWSSNFLGLMLTFPIISALIAAGRIFAVVALFTQSTTASAIVGFGNMFHVQISNQAVTTMSIFASSMVWQAIAIGGAVVPYYLFPQAVAWSNQLLKRANGAFMGMTKGMREGLAKARGNAAERRHQERMTGTRGFLGKRGAAAYRAVVNAPKNAHLRPSRWRSNYRDMEQQIAERHSGEQLKAGGARAFNNDDASAAAAYATSDRDFIRRYRAAGRSHGVEYSTAQAQAALSRVRNAMGGAQMGTRTMRVAAQHFRTSMTNSAYAAGPAGLAALRGDLRHLVDNGDITENDAAGWMKENNGRTDYSKNSYGGTLAFVQGVDANGNVVNDQAQLATMQVDGAFRNADPRELIGGHGRAVESFADSAVRTLDAAIATGNQRQIDYALADVASVHSSLSSVSQEKGDRFANTVMSQPMRGVPPREVPIIRTRTRSVPGPVGAPDREITEQYQATELRVPTVREYLDIVRRDSAGHPGFHDRSREYASGYAASAAEAASAAVTPPTPQG